VSCREMRLGAGCVRAELASREGWAEKAGRGSGVMTRLMGWVAPIHGEQSVGVRRCAAVRRGSSDGVERWEWACVGQSFGLGRLELTCRRGVGCSEGQGVDPAGPVIWSGLRRECRDESCRRLDRVAATREVAGAGRAVLQRCDAS
jgi:hypothetical protein